VIQALNRAQKTIHLAMYGLTHPGIVDDALVAAKNRGVDVALKLDKLESAGKTQAASGYVELHSRRIDTSRFGHSETVQDTREKTEEVGPPSWAVGVGDFRPTLSK
jgi:PLD-like domain